MFWPALQNQVRKLINGNVARKRRRCIPYCATEALEPRALPAATPLGSVIVSKDVNFFTTESGGSTQFTVKLSEAPVAKKASKSISISLPISSSNSKEGTVNRTEITFNANNWNTPQPVTVTGVNDDAIDGDKIYSIVLGKLKATNVKNFTKKINPTDLSTVNRDNDQAEPEVLFDAEDLVINDASSKFIPIRLSSRPTADVLVTLSVTEGNAQGRVAVGEFTFTPSNWNVPQNILVGMYLEGLHDGDRDFEISVDTSSNDPDYDELPTDYINIVNHDIDPLETDLDGGYVGSYSGSILVSGNLIDVSGAVNFSVDFDEVIPVLPTPGQGTVEGDEIVFSLNAGTTFTGKFTENNDGSVTATGTWQYFVDGVPSGGGTWSASGPQFVQPGMFVSQTSGIVINEGEQQAISFSLLTPPTADVVIEFILSTGTGQAILSSNSLTFTPDNWDVPQTLTITGVQDTGVDGDQEFSFVARPTSDDFDYATVLPQTITVTIHDLGQQVVNLDGLYSGLYDGTVTFGGIVTPISALVSVENRAVEFSVIGDVVSVTKPAPADGTISGGVGSFFPGGDAGLLSGAQFSGTFVENPDGSITAVGTWSISNSTLSGSGTWTANRPAP